MLESTFFKAVASEIFFYVACEISDSDYFFNLFHLFEIALWFSFKIA